MPRATQMPRATSQKTNPQKRFDMKTWNENGYEMTEENGTVYVNDHGFKMIFVKWAELGSGNVVPVCWVPVVKDGVAK